MRSFLPHCTNVMRSFLLLLLFLLSLLSSSSSSQESLQSQQWAEETERTLSFIQTNLSITLPPWALRIPEPPPFTVSFLNFIHNTRTCDLEGVIFGKNCGMCQFDCTFLRDALQSRLLEAEAAAEAEADTADVIILSPVMSERKAADPPGDAWLRIRALLALPRRAPGKFYVVHKACARCLPNEPDCTSERAADDEAAERVTVCRLLFRKDFIFADVDLGEHDLDDDRVR